MSLPRSFGASNRPGTCLWCGRKLQPMRLGTAEALAAELRKIDSRSYGGDKYREREIAQAKETHKRNAGKLGGYGDGYFCTLGCGREFGLAMARNGRRLEPREA